MSTTPTTRNYDLTRLQQGPGDLWYIGASGPADGSNPVLTLAYDLSPDSSAHPSAVHLGGTTAGITSVFKPKWADIEIDQFSGPVDHYLEKEAAMMEATLAQLDPKIMQYVHPGATFSSASSQGQLTFGGALPPTAPGCFAMIARKRHGSSFGFYCTVLFVAHGTAEAQWDNGRTKITSYKCTFTALTDTTRVAGRQMGVFYEGIAPSS